MRVRLSKSNPDALQECKHDMRHAITKSVTNNHIYNAVINWHLRGEKKLHASIY